MFDPKDESIKLFNPKQERNNLDEISRKKVQINFAEFRQEI
jgi:hypothetical protein